MLITPRMSTLLMNISQWPRVLRSMSLNHKQISQEHLGFAGTQAILRGLGLTSLPPPFMPSGLWSLTLGSLSLAAYSPFFGNRCPYNIYICDIFLANLMPPTYD